MAKSIKKVPELEEKPAETNKVSSKSETAKALRDTFIGKELLQASIVQRELMVSIRELNSNLKMLDDTMNLIMEHEFVDLHKSKWRIIAYQILLGILFAMGTVMGFAIMSWMTYTFFKDSETLKRIVDSQMKMRQINIQEIREKAHVDSFNMPFSKKPEADAAIKEPLVAPELPIMASGSLLPKAE